MDRVTVLTGAGISTAAGIPDFRGPQGVWTLDPAAADLLDIDRYAADPAVRRAGWRTWAASPVWSARPAPAHRALARLEAVGAVVAVCTQNFDGLHTAAGSRRVLELHGNATLSRCRDCAATVPTADVLARLDADPDPRCAACGGLLAPAVVHFGELLPTDVLDAAVEAAAACDQLWAIGSSLTVHPAAGLVGVAADHGARVVVVNAQPTPYDAVADEIVREVEPGVAELVARVLAG